LNICRKIKYPFVAIANLGSKSKMQNVLFQEQVNDEWVFVQNQSTIQYCVRKICGHQWSSDRIVSCHGTDQSLFRKTIGINIISKSGLYLSALWCFLFGYQSYCCFPTWTYVVLCKSITRHLLSKLQSRHHKHSCWWNSGASPIGTQNAHCRQVSLQPPMFQPFISVMLCFHGLLP